MSDIVNTHTGEVISRDESDFAVKKADELKEFRPHQSCGNRVLHP